MTSRLHLQGVPITGVPAIVPAVSVSEYMGLSVVFYPEFLLFGFIVGFVNITVANKTQNPTPFVVVDLSQSPINDGK